MKVTTPVADEVLDGGIKSYAEPCRAVRPDRRRHELLRGLHLRELAVDRRAVLRPARGKRRRGGHHHRVRRAARVRLPTGLRTAQRPDASVLADHHLRLRRPDDLRAAACPRPELAARGRAGRPRAARACDPESTTGRDAVPCGEGDWPRLGVRGARGARPAGGAVRPPDHRRRPRLPARVPAGLRPAGDSRGDHAALGYARRTYPAPEELAGPGTMRSPILPAS